jgi:hypothetical protein
VRVERAQVLAVFPPLEGAPAPPVFPLPKDAPAPIRASISVDSGRREGRQDSGPLALEPPSNRGAAAERGPLHDDEAPTERAAQAKRTRKRPTTPRKPTKRAAAAQALGRLFPSGRPPHTRDELLRLLKKEPGLETLSPSTLERAIAIAWPEGSSKHVT